jgi:Domain of unknown function (DUF5666)
MTLEESEGMVLAGHAAGESPLETCMTEHEITFNERLSRRGPIRAALLVGACLAIVAGAAVTMGASPSASPAAPGATTKPEASGDPDRPEGGRGFFGGGFFDGRGGPGGPGIHFGAISITAIDGSNLTLTTEDGWTRTIAVTATTTITKGGTAIDIGDVSVGDKIRFGQTRNADGTFTVNAIQVVLPSVAGTVTAKTATTITVEQRDGSSATIHVDGDTTYDVAGVTDADLGDVAVGMRLVAVGTQNTDGSLDATAVHAGTGKFRGGSRDHDKSDQPTPSASPESSSGAG